MRDVIAELRSRAARLPRVSLTELPTPLQACSRLSAAVGQGVKLFFKRDDLTMVGLGGNKVRKLEFTMGKFQAEGYDAVVHGLAGQSNYCRQTAAVCAMLGIPCHLVLRSDHKTDEPPQGNLLLSSLFGAQVTMVEPDEQEEVKRRLVDRLRAEGRKPYLVGYHDEVLGAVAYSLCLAEILEQLAARGDQADFVCTTGWCGTQAGLVLGQRLLGFKGTVQGFCTKPADEGPLRAQIARIAQDAAALLGYAETFSTAEIRNTTAYAGEAYGQATASGLEAIALLGRTEGLAVGPVYTGKGLAGVIDYLRTGKIAPHRTVVFLHTGGTPEVFTYHAEIAEALGPQFSPETVFASLGG